MVVSRFGRWNGMYDAFSQEINMFKFILVVIPTQLNNKSNMVNTVLNITYARVQSMTRTCMTDKKNIEHLHLLSYIKLN
jgi:hypothetical protein